MTEAQGEQGEGESISREQSVAQEVGRVTSGKLDVSGLRIETSSGEITTNVSPKASTDNSDVLVDATVVKLSSSSAPGIVSCGSEEPGIFLIKNVSLRNISEGSISSKGSNSSLWENMFRQLLTISILHPY